jgi:hypothetical protein
MIFCEPANIFRGATNDYNIRVMNCKKKSYSIVVYIDRIANIIKNETGYDPFENTTWRKQEYVLSRQLFMVMLYKRGNGKSLSYVANILGKDHATLSYAQKTINNLLDTDKSFVELYQRIENKVKLIK